jgi:hypothetical protein
MVVMDFELFYEEIEGFGLVYAFEKIWQLWNFSNQQETRQDSVSHQFQVFKVLQWPLKEQNRIGILSKIPFKRVRVEDYLRENQLVLLTSKLIDIT